MWLGWVPQQVKACVAVGRKEAATKALLSSASDKYDDVSDEGGSPSSDTSELCKIYEVDLLDQDSFKEVFTEDCVAVVHCGALPFKSKRDALEGQHIINEHLRMTQGLLNLCQKTPSIQKLVLCSCLLTVTDEFLPGKTYTEDDWNETSSASRRVHAAAKTQAERLVTSFAAREDCGFKLATLLPGTLLGPHGFPGAMNQAYDLLLHFLEGRIQGVPNVEVFLTDVRDLANALLVALEKPEVQGRYIVCAEQSMSLAHMMQTTLENFGHMPVPQHRLPDFVVRAALRKPTTEQQEWMLHNVGRQGKLDTTRAKALYVHGVSFRDPRYSVVDTVSYMRSIDAIKPVSKPRSCSIL